MSAHPAKVAPASARAPQERIIALDALRVLAAFVVLVQHFRQTFELQWPEWLTKGVLDSKAAVMLFFVLSGHVLALSFCNSAPSWRAWAKFGVRRAFRLYPVYWAALFLAFVVLWMVQQRGAGQVTGQPALFLEGAGLQLKQWLLQTTLIAPGMLSDFALPPVWTLMTEAKISMVFPILAWPILRSRPIVVGGLLAVLVFGSHWLGTRVVGTTAFLGMFALGAVLCRVPTHFWRRFNHATWAVLVVLGLALYAAISWRYMMPSIWMGYYLCALGSLILIAATMYWSWLCSALTRLQESLGVDLSYGIYILHYPVLVALKKFAGPELIDSPVLAFAFAVVATILLALFLHFFLERPAINLGRRLTRSRSPRPS